MLPEAALVTCIFLTIEPGRHAADHSRGAVGCDIAQHNKTWQAAQQCVSKGPAAGGGAHAAGVTG